MSALAWLQGRPDRTDVYRRQVPDSLPPFARFDADRGVWMCGCWHAYQARRCETPSRFQDLPWGPVPAEVLQ
ncbi:hypothetical protein [Azohydromonas aeria]|uniref:hypothetical protein n=1 Tax=Azohydromonas aeria TaxID=2590212 RepID=UPI0012FB5704|nr:hypothetical protein [Azohydromonas aeria]